MPQPSSPWLLVLVVDAVGVGVLVTVRNVVAVGVGVGRVGRGLAEGRPGVPGTVIGDAPVATGKVAIPERLGLHIEQMTSSTGPGRDVTNCAPTIPVVGPQ